MRLREVARPRRPPAASAGARQRCRRHSADADGTRRSLKGSPKHASEPDGGDRSSRRLWILKSKIPPKPNRSPKLSSRTKASVEARSPNRSPKCASKLEALVEVGILDFNATVDCKCQEQNLGTQFRKNSQEDLTFFAKCWIFSSNFRIELVSTKRTSRKICWLVSSRIVLNNPKLQTSFYLIWKNEHSH